MSPETLIFMPNGDVTIVLIRHVTRETTETYRTSSNLSNSPELGKSTSSPDQTSIDEDEQPEDNSVAEVEELADLEDNVLYFAPDPPENLNGPLYPPPPRAARGSDASSRRDRSQSPPASFWASLKRKNAEELKSSEDEHPVISPMSTESSEGTVVSSHEVHCVVSSQHMILASQLFQTVLGGNTNEAITLQTKGHVTIPLSVDSNAMIILLNIIHGASRKVPRQVSLEVLSQIGVLVSSLGMLETVEFFSDTWIDNLKREGFPKSYNEKVLPLLFIFWVFNRPSEFRNITRIAQRESTEMLHSDVRDIPISMSIINTIKKDREFAMAAAVTAIHSLITKYLVGQTVCDGSLDDELRYACDAMILGSLMKSSRKIGIWPMPETPFNGRNFKDLALSIRSIKILDVCNKTSSRRWTSHGPSSNSHGLEELIEASMKSIEAGLNGLDLSEYTKKSEDPNAEFQKIHLRFCKERSGEQMKGEIGDQFQVIVRDEVVNPQNLGLEVPQADESVLSHGSLGENDFTNSMETTKEQGWLSTAPIKKYPREPSDTGIHSQSRLNSPRAKQPEQEKQRLSPPHDLGELHQLSADVPPRIISQKVEFLGKEEVKVTPQCSQQQELRSIIKSTGKIDNEPPREEEKSPLREEVKILGDRKLNRTPSYPNIRREDMRSPVNEMQVIPKLASIEEIIEKVSLPAKEVKSSIFELGDALKNTAPTAEAEELWAPSKNFKMRKSKKTFSTRF